MNRILIISIFFSVSTIIPTTVTANPYQDSQVQQNNAFGPGIHMDQYGRAVSAGPTFVGDMGYYSDSIIQKNNSYGPGVHMDQYGRAVSLQEPNYGSSYTPSGEGGGALGWAKFFYQISQDRKRENERRTVEAAKNWIYNYAIASSDKERALRRDQLLNVVNTPYLVDECRRVADEIDNERFEIYLDNLKKALANDDPDAKMIIGYNYATGSNGFPLNMVSSIQWLKAASEQASVEAIDILGYFYETGYGVEQDIVEALYYYRLGELEGSPFSQHQLGDMFYEGRGVTQNTEKAIELHSKAAKQEYKESIDFLNELNNAKANN